MEQPRLVPDYIFETSWEVCNKVGGIYTVISTKAITLTEQFGDKYILIGPDVWKETHQNPEFLEDKYLYRSWRTRAEAEGLKIKMGRWNITGTPVVILVDFTPYFSEKDKVFAWLWETYQLDSISGGWDYIEPALFGYAAARVIESFYNYNVAQTDKITAHFHEWLTGTGLLYVKNLIPQAGTVFTTHATVIGRSVAGNGMPLYSNLETYQPDSIARQFGIVAKQSLELIAAQKADCLTTISESTGNECKHFLGRKADLLTPNGFEDTFVPSGQKFDKKREAGREKLFTVAEGVMNRKLARESMLILTSGRYEFRNKGIDLFIDALGRLNKSDDLRQEILAYIAVPAYQTGARNEVAERMEKRDFREPCTDDFLTHGLHEPETDPILIRILQNDLHNRPEDKVKVVYVPAYLNGTDGIFNLSYYEFLIGFDGTVFPSYYEPWGYTPLESLAFHIPTLTTTLAGFGQWIRSNFPENENCIIVIDRGDDNETEVVEEIVKCVSDCSAKPKKEMQKIRREAWELSRSALWKHLIDNYHAAFSFALEMAAGRFALYAGKQAVAPVSASRGFISTTPEWKKVLIQPSIPENLKDLIRISRNLWWTWNSEGLELFEMINNHRWQDSRHNPVAMIEALSYKEMKELSANGAFIDKLQQVAKKFDEYMSKGESKTGPSVAYFSMEYGLHDTIKIYSGGLGMLAGDYLKQASDSNCNITGIGILYRYGYFQQYISITGEQIAKYVPQKFTHLPLIPVRDRDGNWLKITFALPGRNMYAKIWRVDVGRIPLYLLDTDIDENIESDRVITHQLYGGDSENRLRQEILLGIGGIRLLNLLNLKTDVYHSNEGHSAFIGIERLRTLIEHERLTFSQALEVVRSSTLFTTHTPVPAGHDTFTEDLLRTYFSHYPDRLNIRWEQFLNLGKMNEGDPDEKFSMSVLAARLSQEINGVSRIHGDVTCEMFRSLYPGYYPKELHIGYVTNGVHFPTWTAKSWQDLFSSRFGEGFIDDQSNESFWKKIHDVDDEVVWKIKLNEKNRLNEYLRKRVFDEMTRRNENPKLIFQIKEAVRPHALTIGFARRFATYKRAHLLFSNLDRLSRIVNNSKKPVVFIFAGKAHPNDKAGQDLIRRIYEISKTPDFLGKILFIENYDIELAQFLIRGVDVWLNTPTRPLEASGTSGEKAVMNGVVNFSVLDGWWAEGYRPNAGWALKEEVTYFDPKFQDELDAETIYTILEDEIIPIYYNVGARDVPHKWVSFIKNTISDIAPHFTMKRQLDDYYSQYYHRLAERSGMITGNNYEKAREIAAWKRNMIRGWESIEVVAVNIPDSTQKPMVLGEAFKAEVVLDMNELTPEDVGIEILFGKKVNDLVNEPILIKELEVTGSDGEVVTFGCEVPFDEAGVYDFAFRLFPKNDLLAHRQDFNLVRWI